MITKKEHLKSFRKSLKMTQREFSEAIGYSYSYFSKVENGDLKFYGGLMKEVNAYAQRLEAYKKGCEAYNKASKEVKKTEGSKADIFTSIYAFLSVLIIGLLVWIHKN